MASSDDDRVAGPRPTTARREHSTEIRELQSS